jgi:hypothetical protein
MRWLYTAPAPQEPPRSRRAAVTAARTHTTVTITGSTQREHALTSQTAARNSKKGACGALVRQQPFGL